MLPHTTNKALKTSIANIAIGQLVSIPFSTDHAFHVIKEQTAQLIGYLANSINMEMLQLNPNTEIHNSSA